VKTSTSKTIRMIRLSCAAASLMIGGMMAVSGPASAQQFPSKPISIITNVGPGSNFDRQARVFAEKLKDKLGVPVVVQNVPGGQGILATQRVLNAKSDGYTLLFAGSSVALTPLVMPSAGYKPEDFEALAPIGQSPFILFVSSAVPSTDIPSFVQYLKTNRKDVNVGVLTSSPVTVMLARKFAKLAGGELTEIGYRGSPDTMAGLLMNDIQMMYTSYQIAAPHLTAGKIKAIGTLAEDRSQLMPDLPTFKEKGHPLTIHVWAVLYGKSDLPPDVRKIIREASREIVTSQEYIKALGPTGMEPWNIPFDSVHAVVKEDAEQFIKDAKEFNVKFE